MNRTWTSKLISRFDRGDESQEIQDRLNGDFTPQLYKIDAAHAWSPGARSARTEKRNPWRRPPALAKHPCCLRTGKGGYSSEKSAANAFGFSSSPVASLVSSFQRQRPARGEDLLLHELADLLVADVDHRRRVGALVAPRGRSRGGPARRTARPSCSCGSTPGR